MRDVTIVVAENDQEGYVYTNAFRLDIGGTTAEFWEYVRNYPKAVAAERLKGEAESL